MRWLQQSDRKRRKQVDETLALLDAMLQEEPAEQPQPYADLIISRNLGIPYFAGSLYEMPYITMLEMDACIRAENTHATQLGSE